MSRQNKAYSKAVFIIYYIFINLKQKKNNEVLTTLVLKLHIFKF